jgi:S1-C subfamily serine protease
LIYLLIEFAIHKRRSYVAAREYIAADVIDDFDLGPGAWVGGPDSTLNARKLEPVEYRKPAGALRPLLGVEVTEVDHPATGELSVSVVSVAAGGAAHEAGLVVGDVITRWNNMPIHTKSDFAAAVRDSIIGSVVTLQVVRPALGGFGSTVEYLRMVVRGVATH